MGERSQNTLQRSINTLLTRYPATFFPLSSQLQVGKTHDLLAKPSLVSTTKEGTPANGYAETWIFGAYGTSGSLSDKRRRSAKSKTLSFRRKLSFRTGFGLCVEGGRLRRPPQRERRARLVGRSDGGA